MDIRSEILKEHSKQNALRVAWIAGSDPQLLKELIDITLGDDTETGRKAAWALRHCYENRLINFDPHITRLIRFLNRKNIHHAVKRNILGILRTVKIPEKHKGDLLDQCFSYLESGRETIAVKAFSIDIITNIASGEPAILKELRIVLEDQLPYASAGLKSKTSKIITLSKKYKHEW